MNNAEIKVEVLAEDDSEVEDIAHDIKEILDKCGITNSVEVLNIYPCD